MRFAIDRYAVGTEKRLVPVNLRDNRTFRLERRDFTVLNVAK